MEIRNYIKEDINDINKFGSLLHNNYKFNLDDFSFCKVITEENNIIGFIIYSIIYERAEIVDIIIDPSKRKEGYGIKLLCNVIDIINKSLEEYYKCKFKKTKISISTNPNNMS